MELDDEDIQSFIDMYRKTYHEDITIPEAREMASRLLMLAEQIMKPLPEELAAAGITPGETPNYLHKSEPPSPASHGDVSPIP